MNYAQAEELSSLCGELTTLLDDMKHPDKVTRAIVAAFETRVDADIFYPADMEAETLPFRAHRTRLGTRGPLPTCQREYVDMLLRRIRELLVGEEDFLADLDEIEERLA